MIHGYLLVYLLLDRGERFSLNNKMSNWMRVLEREHVCSYWINAFYIILCATLTPPLRRTAMKMMICKFL
jgi:hypothetical protein